ncbi:MAG: polymer-forming cytoskeletal protein [Rhodospirillales bacterium]
MFNKANKTSGAPATAMETPPRAPSSSTRAGAVPSIISADLVIEGNLHSTGDIQIDGRVIGDIQSRAVTIGQGADVQGHVACESARVNGRMSGEIKAKSVVISKSAEIVGDVIHESVAIEAGAHIEGSLRRIASEAAERLPAPDRADWSESDQDLVEIEDVRAPAPGGSADKGS